MLSGGEERCRRAAEVRKSRCLQPLAVKIKKVTKKPYMLRRNSQMYEKVTTDLKFVEREKKVEQFWKENRIFEKSISF